MNKAQFEWRNHCFLNRVSVSPCSMFWIDLAAVCQMMCKVFVVITEFMNKNLTIRTHYSILPCWNSIEFTYLHHLPASGQAYVWLCNLIQFCIIKKKNKQKKLFIEFCLVQWLEHGTQTRISFLQSISYVCLRACFLFSKISLKIRHFQHLSILSPIPHVFLNWGEIHSLYNVKVTTSKCVALVHSQGCVTPATLPIIVSEHFHHLQKSMSISGHSPLLLLYPSGCTKSFPVLMDLLTVETSYKWFYTICGLLCLAFSLGRMFLRFMNIVAYITTSFLFMAEWCSGVCVYVYICMYVPVCLTAPIKE